MSMSEVQTSESASVRLCSHVISSVPSSRISASAPEVDRLKLTGVSVEASSRALIFSSLLGSLKTPSWLLWLDLVTAAGKTASVKLVKGVNVSLSWTSVKTQRGIVEVIGPKAAQTVMTNVHGY